MSDRIVVVGGTRTPFVKSRSVFNDLPPSTLGGVTLRETVARTGIDPKLIDEVFFGIVSPPAEGTNISREALFDSGLPSEIPCTTLNRYCASSLECAASMAAKIQSGQIEIGLVGGVESISSVRALFSEKATAYFQDFMKMKTTSQKLSHLGRFKVSYLAPHSPGIKEPTTGLTMGQSADLMAREFQVSREEQDEFAVASHKKAAEGWERGFFKSHVVPVATPDGKFIDKDNYVRPDSSVEKIAGLRPVFYKDGTISAGNASPLTDGASSALLMKESKAKELGLTPIAAIRSYAAAGVDIRKEALLIGPAFAMPKALKMAGIEWSDLKLVEIHEAFAAQVLATVKAIESDEWCKEKLGLGKAFAKVDRDWLNIYGGSIPLGHPFGATGTRMLVQTALEMQEKKRELGLISICAAGGLGSVMILEAI